MTVPFEQFKQNAIARDIKMGLGQAPDAVYQLQYEDYVLGPNHKEINVDSGNQRPVLPSSQEQRRDDYIVPPTKVKSQPEMKAAQDIIRDYGYYNPELLDKYVDFNNRYSGPGDNFAVQKLYNLLVGKPERGR